MKVKTLGSAFDIVGHLIHGERTDWLRTECLGYERLINGLGVVEGKVLPESRESTSAVIKMCHVWTSGLRDRCWCLQSEHSRVET
jgi:hypothetical protein